MKDRHDAENYTWTLLTHNLSMDRKQYQTDPYKETTCLQISEKQICVLPYFSTWLIWNLESNLNLKIIYFKVTPKRKNLQVATILS